jgi:serine/threonine protein kinase
MPHQVVCPNPQCRKTLSVKDDLAGRPLRCPACNTLLAASSTSSRPRNPSTINTSSSPRQGTMESPLAQQPIAEPSASTPKPVKGGGKEDLPAAIGPYQISRELGRGAFGVVYLGHDPMLKRDVAIKVLKKDALNSARAIQRFLREAQVVAQMHHNHIVPVYELGEHEGCQYIASRFVPGKTLADLIPDNGMEPAEAVKLVLQLLEALAYAHEMNVLHRDVKPANAIVDARGHLSLMDFGLAGWLGQTQERATQDGTVMGTPAYMPPEQARGDIQHLSAASDQYSASVVLYELLTGRLPFKGGPIFVLLRNVIETPPPRPSEYRSGLDRKLEAICLRALAKRPQERFPSCREFAEALRTWQAGRDPCPAVVVPDLPEVLPVVIPLKVDAVPEQETAVRVPEPPRRRKARQPAKAEPSFARLSDRWWLWLVAAGGAGASVVLLVVAGLWATRVFKGTTQDSSPLAAGTLSQDEANQFVPLFNRRDLAGWQLENKPVNWKNTDGVITATSRSKRWGSGGVITTTKAYSANFRLRCEVLAGQPGGEYSSQLRFRERITPVPNNGFVCYVVPLPGLGAQGVEEDWGIGSLHVVVSQKGSQRLARASKTDLGIKPDEWYRLEIIAEGERVRVMVNGHTTVDYSAERAESSKGKIGFRCARESRIVVRNVEIMELP